MGQSRKPPQKGPYQGVESTPRLNHYASEAEITSTGRARVQVNRFNRQIQRLTMPYNRAAELRAGQSYPRQLERMRAMERGDTPYPRPRVGGVRGGRLLQTS